MSKTTISLMKKSGEISFSIVAGISTVAGIMGYTIRDLSQKSSWWKCSLILLVIFIVIACIAFFVLKSQEHREYTTTINGKTVSIIVGDIFQVNGWKTIPCNERFDTQVDDQIIAHNSLNGIMIDRYISDINDLNQSIENAKQDSSPLKGEMKLGRFCYPLGRLIPYNDFLLLAFSHFNNQNCAFIGIGEYEQLLIRMWSEMRRVYAAKPIFLPLIGSGITNIEGETEKDYTKMLKCILCTLRSSKFKPDKGVTIVLTQDVLKEIDMNSIREEF